MAILFSACVSYSVMHVFVCLLEQYDVTSAFRVWLLSRMIVVVVVVDPTPPTCCQQSPAPEIMWQPAVSPPRWQGKAPLCRDSSRGPG